MDWDQMYQNQTTPWDKGAAAPPLLEWLDANPGVIQGRTFVPGCGLGHDVQSLAAAAPKAEIIGFDLSETAIAAARERRKFENESYQSGDLFNLDPALRGAFDWVWEHTCFCAINQDQRDDYVESVWKSLRDDRESQLLGVFYLDPYDDEHQPGEGPPHGTCPDELRRRFSGSGRFEILEEYIPKRSYDGREGLEWVMRMRKIPSII